MATEFAGNVWTEAGYKNFIRVNSEQGWLSGERTRLPPMLPQGSIPRLGVICGLSSMILYSAPRGFPPDILVFPSPQSKTNIGFVLR